MKGRSLSIRLLTVAGGIVVALAIGELALRALTAARADDVPHRRWFAERDQPDFRDRAYGLVQSPDAFRVLAVGDSFTWGYGVAAADAYPDRLQTLLESLDTSRRFEVINWSHPGWNTVEEWRSLKHRLTELEPDLVILGFVLNDPEPSNREERARLHRSLARQPPANRLGRFLDGNSLLFGRLFEAAGNADMRRRLTRYYHSLYEDGPAWSECRRALRRLKAASRKAGAPMVVVIFPIFDSPFDQRYSYFSIHETLAGTCGELQLDCLDLRGDYWTYDARTLAVDPFIDAHPNERAHEIAAGAILEGLLARSLLPVGQRPG